MNNLQSKNLNNLQSFLKEELQKRFTAHRTVVATEELIASNLKKDILEKYKNKIIFAHSLEYSLFDVQLSFSNSVLNPMLSEFNIRLIYFCSSKVPKDKRVRIEKAKKTYKNEGFLEWSNFKTPLWHRLDYSAMLNDFINDNFEFNLDIE